MHTLHRILLALVAMALISTSAFGDPATTTSSSNISPQAAPIIASVRQAYSKLTSLDLAGKISGDFDVDGQKESHNLDFTTSFSAPNLFRLDTKDDALIGNNGNQLYIYAKNRNLFLSADAPKTRVLTSALPDPFVDLISSQDPSLALALSSDPAAELSDNYSKIEKLDDISIDAHPFTALKLSRKDNQGFTTLLIDPKTSLVRRAMIDVAAVLATRGAGDIKKALITIDYITVTPNATTRPTEFAWAPPSGARDAADVREGDDEAANHLVGTTAPAFTLKDFDDKEISLASLKGKVVVLDFWATWCGPCVASLPHLNQLYLDFKDQDVRVYAINQAEDKDLVSGFMHSKNLTVPVLLDTESKVGDLYDAHAIPETVIVGPDGVISKVFIGAGPDTESQPPRRRPIRPQSQKINPLAILKNNSLPAQALPIFTRFHLCRARLMSNQSRHRGRENKFAGLYHPPMNLVINGIYNQSPADCIRGVCARTTAG